MHLLLLAAPLIGLPGICTSSSVMVRAGVDHPRQGQVNPHIVQFYPGEIIDDAKRTRYLEGKKARIQPAEDAATGDEVVSVSRTAHEDSTAVDGPIAVETVVEVVTQQVVVPAPSTADEPTPLKTTPLKTTPLKTTPLVPMQEDRFIHALPYDIYQIQRDDRRFGPPRTLFNSTDSIVCETTSASPYFGDVLKALDPWKQDQSRGCEQKNGWGSKCTLLTTYDSAAVSICSPKHAYLPCSWIAVPVEYLVHKCFWPDPNGYAKVGGIIHLRSGMTISVHHSRDA